MSRESRYFRNPYLHSGSSSSSSSASTASSSSSSCSASSSGGELGRERRALQRSIVKHTQTDRMDASVYTGLCGVALAFFRSAVAHAGSIEGAPSARKEWKAARKYCRAAVAAVQKRDRASRFTFHTGCAGPYALSAVLHALEGNTERASDYQQALEGMCESVLETADCDELLYGLAGYLHALLFVNTRLAVDEGVLRAIVDAIITDGRNGASHGAPLMWEWHRKQYLGGAHGVCGILMTLLQAWQWVGADARADVQATLGWLLDTQVMASGNITSSVGKGKDSLVQWCHGAPGLVPMLVLASRVLPTHSGAYLEHAQSAGDVIWERGLLKKGPGLCHGISGNAYAFLSLYRATHDAMWRDRALKFALFAFSGTYKRGNVGADSPWSLYQGYAGLLALCWDLQGGGEGALFPGYEL